MNRNIPIHPQEEFYHRASLHQWIIGCGATIMVLIFAYGYLLTTTVIHMIEYKQEVARVDTLTKTLDAEEAAYLGLDHALTLYTAYGLGFIDAANPDYVVVNSGTRLTMLR